MSDDSLEMQVGRLDGRLTGVEGRMTRTEETLLRIDNKLDAIQMTLASRGGLARGGATAIHWILTGLAVLASWLTIWHSWGAVK